jgi:thiosulfate/3-mercaptopyruvate sulfurtransferase
MEVPMLRSLLAQGFAAVLFTSAAVAAEPLVTPDWLASHLDDQDIVILDLRSAAGYEETDYVKEHIPGAVWSDYSGDWRTTRDNVPGVLPPVEQLEEYLSSIGVDEDKRVVIVPAGEGATEFGGAARVYWTLKYLGHDEVSILNGGWSGWKEAGLPTETGGVTPRPSVFTAEPRQELLMSTADAARDLGTQKVFVDARPFSFFRGEDKHPAAPRHGRLPGALHLDNASFYDEENQRLKPFSELQAAVPASLAPDAQIVSYCNTAHWAATNWFVLHELLGYEDVTLYDESMVGWTQDLERPVESDRSRLDDLKAWWNSL